MVVPVTEFELPYEDVFTVNLPVSPPAELLQQLNTDQQREMARLLHAPKAIHQARLTNESSYPLTTAPALLMREGQLLGQAMMTYTPVGGQVDVEVTAAVNIAVAKQDLETGRTPNAANWGGNSFDRLDLEGTIDCEQSHRQVSQTGSGAPRAGNRRLGRTQCEDLTAQRARRRMGSDRPLSRLVELVQLAVRLAPPQRDRPNALAVRAPGRSGNHAPLQVALLRQVT